MLRQNNNLPKGDLLMFRIVIFFSFLLFLSSCSSEFDAVSKEQKELCDQSLKKGYTAEQCLKFKKPESGINMDSSAFPDAY